MEHIANHICTAVYLYEYDQKHFISAFFAKAGKNCVCIFQTVEEAAAARAPRKPAIKSHV